jgi:hypothetical protein
MAPSSPAINAPGTAMDSRAPIDMSDYKAARAACDRQPVTSKDQCRTDLNALQRSRAEVRKAVGHRLG